MRFSQLDQLRSNFGDKLLTAVNPQTGRLHGSFQLAKAKSGRFSSSNPNMQNIPKSESVRAVFVAAPGKQLVVADYSQLELRVMAFIANDEVMTEAYRNGQDLHAVTAAGMLGLKPDQGRGTRHEQDEYRQQQPARRPVRGEQDETGDHGEREADESQGHAERGVVQAGARFRPGRHHHHDQQGADPDGQDPPQQRLTGGASLP